MAGPLPSMLGHVWWVITELSMLPGAVVAFVAGGLLDRAGGTWDVDHEEEQGVVLLVHGHRANSGQWARGIVNLGLRGSYSVWLPLSAR